MRRAVQATATDTEQHADASAKLQVTFPFAAVVLMDCLFSCVVRGACGT